MNAPLPQQMNTSRAVEVLRDCRGIGMTWLGPAPAVVLDLWNQGYLRRDDSAPFTYTTVEGAVDSDAQDDVEEAAAE